MIGRLKQIKEILNGSKRRHDSPIQYIETSRLRTLRPEVLDSRTENPLSPEPFVFRAKPLPAKRSEKGYMGMKRAGPTGKIYK